MEYLIRGKNIAVTEAMESHIKNVLNKLEKYNQISNEDRVLVEIELSKENTVTVKCGIDMVGKPNFMKAETSTDDFYKAIDMIAKKFEDQIRRIKVKTYHSKHNHKHKKLGVAIDEEINANNDISEDEEEIL